MAGSFARWGRSRRSTSPKKPQARVTVLQLEAVEPRLMLSGSPTPVHTAPTVAHSISVSNNGVVTGKTATLSVLGSDAGGEAKLVYDWSVTSTPSAGTATFSLNNTNAAKNETVTFNEAGTYGLTVKIVNGFGLSVSTATTIKVTPTLTTINVGQGTSVNVTGTSQVLAAQGLDQFGHLLATQPTFQWSAATTPSGASAPTFATSGANATVTFGMAGAYGLKVAAAGNSSVSTAISVTVSQTATSISVTPGTASLAEGAKQQFTAKVLDQFHNALTTQPTIAWSTNGGSISTSGLFTAPNTAGSDTITAKSGSLSATATATVQANTGGLQNAFLSKLVTSLDADGSISRADMIQIFSAVAANGAVTASEFSDLKTILGEATSLAMPGYVQTLASDVVNGNVANATYQGQKLGNLATGSSATQLNDLVGKWFLGTDEPTLTNSSLVYKTVSGSLFSGTPSHANEQQGMLGDCYFISSLGTIADSNPTAIENMFINNGDGTYTVRFFNSGV
ncbi:MAG TPA: LEPR-XLL domain-containing protein, partial [Pirellulales bacterium]|nr:LEPR-XLL domain-containing protein [Pirellulales bacterium]